jgi:hypothetical protein
VKGSVRLRSAFNRLRGQNRQVIKLSVVATHPNASRSTGARGVNSSSPMPNGLAGRETTSCSMRQ